MILHKGSKDNQATSKWCELAFLLFSTQSLKPNPDWLVFFAPSATFSLYLCNLSTLLPRYITHEKKTVWRTGKAKCECLHGLIQSIIEVINNTTHKSHSDMRGGGDKPSAVHKLSFITHIHTLSEACEMYNFVSSLITSLCLDPHESISPFLRDDNLSMKFVLSLLNKLIIQLSFGLIWTIESQIKEG